MTTLSVFRSRLKVKIFKKKGHFSCVWQPFHTKSGPFFALPVSVIIVHVDLCCFFQQVRTQHVFPSPLPGSNVLIDPGIETVSRFCTD